ncbi:MAG: hypothetical protein LBT83_01970 [Tannerella sp.]|nr:hypothetical protein [Tannerella sp.]
MSKQTIYNMLCLCLTIWGVMSCAMEGTEPDRKSLAPEPTTVVRIPMTRGSDAEENDIRSSRMIVFRGNGTFVLNTVHPDNPPPYHNPTFVDTVPVGSLHVYLIANELSTWNLGPEGTVISEAQLTQLIYNYRTYPGVAGFLAYPALLPDVDADHPVPMFGIHKNIYIDSDGNITGDPLTSPNPGVAPYPFTVERIFSKVTLELRCLFSEQANGGDPLQLESIKLMHVPRESYLIPKRYTDAAFFDYFTTSPYLAPTSTYVENNDGFRDSVAFYLPEYLANDTSLYTWFSIMVRVKSTPTVKKELKLVMGEGLIHGNKFMLGDSILPDGHVRNVSDLNIQRNTHYKIDARIMNFDQSGGSDITLNLVVEPWATAATDTTEIGEQMLYVSQNLFTVPTNTAYFGVVNVDTDYKGGWSATVTSTSGASCLISSDGGGSYTSSSYASISSGQLKFTYTGPAGSNAIITVTAGNITRKIEIRHP